MVEKDCLKAETEGATDIRLDQEQVDANGARVGTNRPDLQYTSRDGQRIYIEYDRASSARGAPHRTRTLSNDPRGFSILKRGG